MAYATAADLLAYAGSELELPSSEEQDRLLARASELVDAITLDRVDAEDDEHVEGARDAVCAQVEWWLSAGEDTELGMNVQGYSVGSLSLTYGQGNRAQDVKLAPRARRHLFLAGLLDRRVGVQ
jgi:hypothetical protein